VTYRHAGQEHSLVRFRKEQQNKTQRFSNTLQNLSRSSTLPKLLQQHFISNMPFMRTAVQRLGASSVRRFGAVAGQGGNSLKEFFSGMGLAGAVIGSVGVMLSAFHSVKGTRHLK